MPDNERLDKLSAADIIVLAAIAAFAAIAVLAPFVR